MYIYIHTARRLRVAETRHMDMIIRCALIISACMYVCISTCVCICAHIPTPSLKQAV